MSGLGSAALFTLSVVLPAVTLCIMWGGKEGDIPKERAVGVLEGLGTLCALPCSIQLALSPGKKRNYF